MTGRPSGGSHSAKYTTAEARAIYEALARGGQPTCPRCGALMRETTAGGGTVETIWMIECPGCGRSAFPRDLGGP